VFSFVQKLRRGGGEEEGARQERRAKACGEAAEIENVLIFDLLFVQKYLSFSVVSKQKSILIAVCIRSDIIFRCILFLWARRFKRFYKEAETPFRNDGSLESIFGCDAFGPRIPQID
jgi:hypothetical protein